MTPFHLAHPARLLCACFGAVGGAGLDLSGFDPAVRFQDDLFRAANGRWLKETDIPADKSRYGAFSQLADLSDERLRAIVAELTGPLETQEIAHEMSHPHGSVEHQVAAFYGSFMNTAAIDAAGLAPVTALLAEIDAIETPQQLAQWQGRMQGRINTPLILWVQADFKEPAINRALTWQGGLGLPDRDYYLLHDDARMAAARRAYVTYLGTLATLAGLTEITDPDAAERVLAIEQRIAALHWDNVANRDPARLHNPMTLAELTQNVPGFDWAAFLQAAQLGAVDRLSVSQPSAAIGIAQLFTDIALADWKCYFKLHSLDAVADLLPQAFRDARFAFRGTALTGATTQRPRWQQGIAALNGALGEAVGQLYVARHFTPEHKTRTQALVDNLMTAYRESIDALAWMTPQTKAQAQDKLSKYRTKIGYPDTWRDYRALQVVDGDALGNETRSANFEWTRLAAQAGGPVDRNEWGLTPQTVNAYYNPSLNEIVFPAAILQPPFFDLAADDAINYGAIGAVIGHEISHGFDDQGSQFDGDGVLRNWWTDADRQAFEAVGAQLVAQFERYEPLPGRPLNGQLTLGENTADLSGLQIAFKAYARSVAGQPDTVVDGFSGAQRFFLGWSQVWRDKVRDERSLALLTTDPHSPAEFRANGAALNHDGFHTAFATQPGDQMFKPVAERIRIW